MNIEIFPLEKVIINGISICLNMEKSAVEALMGEGQLIGKRSYYFGGEMAIDYNNDKVEYVEFLAGIDGALRPMIYGCSAFETKAEELFLILKKQNDGYIYDTERGYSYQFDNISVGISRQSVPEEIEEMIEEASRNGNPMSIEEKEYEMKMADYWSTIGFGVEGYYKR